MRGKPAEQALTNQACWDRASDEYRATSTYRRPEELEWARRWPSESIWKARKAG